MVRVATQWPLVRDFASQACAQWAGTGTDLRLARGKEA